MKSAASRHGKKRARKDDDAVCSQQDPTAGPSNPTQRSQRTGSRRAILCGMLFLSAPTVAWSPHSPCFIQQRRSQRVGRSPTCGPLYKSTEVSTEIEPTSQQMDVGHSNESIWVNGDACSSSSPVTKGAHDPSSSVNHDGSGNSNTEPSFNDLPDFLQHEEIGDVPMPTANGGFSHTKASRAKISAANKGKVPWNKGKSRSEETKARIAAGVRARNRERFLTKLKDMNMTEEEYELQKKEERRKREAERRARRTPKGGYRPTEETKQKISQILKEKYARGEVKRRKVDPSKVRRGFTHTEETRKKISESLRKRWAEDPEYRAKMVENASAKRRTSREKISASLRKKWEDPEFRQHMIDKMNANRQGKDSSRHRQRISEAIKKKWQDEEYRKKTQAGLAKRRATIEASRPKSATKGTRIAKKRPAPKNTVAPLSPITVPRKAATRKIAEGKTATKKIKQKSTVSKTKAKKRTAVSPSASPKPVSPLKPAAKNVEPKLRKESKKPKPDAKGNVDLLKEERRDLYDLLYGDEIDVTLNDDDDHSNQPSRTTSTLASVFSLEDDNLDDFDPYGLEDF